MKEQGRFRKLLSLKLGGSQAISWSQILRAEPRKEEKSLRNKRRGPPTFVAGRFWVLFRFHLYTSSNQQTSGPSDVCCWRVLGSFWFFSLDFFESTNVGALRRLLLEGFGFFGVLRCMLVASWGVLGGSWRPLGATWASLAGLVGPLGATWVPLGGLVGRLGRHLGASWGVMGRLGSILERLGGLLAASWSVLGCPGGILGPLGGVLGTSWGV